MGYLRFCLFLLILATSATGFVSCKEQIEQEPLLLLEEGSSFEGSVSTDGPAADNSRCHVCHINYMNEALAFVHSRAGISCEQCHGSSDAHCSDEDNITPPDVMYPEPKIKSFCLDCHSRDKINIPVHKSVIFDLDTKEGYCTECHGDHRLSHRTRRWNKTTGKLIEDDKVRMLTDEMLEKN